MSYKSGTDWAGRVDSKSDKSAFRWHQVIMPVDVSDIEAQKQDADSVNFCFLGFCCDEGVTRNLGRPGAKNGPASIRKEMANWPANFNPKVTLYDAGDVWCDGNQLEEAQEELATVVSKLTQNGYFPILLGGGHEIALGHFKGLLNIDLDKTPAIINFDAHLDLRPVNDKGSSGTMFNQIYQICQLQNRHYSYLCIGPQTYANTPSLFAKADEFGAEYILAKDVVRENLQNVSELIEAFVKKQDSIYLTVCTDVLSAAHAPGVSAVQPFGLDPEIVLELIKQIIRSGKVCSLDIAEVSPRFDSDNRTAKLMAVYIYSIINTLVEMQLNK
ncbi:formimidoylglutamase [Carboxylicivirga sp. N1Y90]|uniref:formimidoylglutamase n=1 Tax=Carboxylicivirga fragile TaxID=3417571 RepID=UPI003D352C35|nr:formimidoylglutamase [Marinilabiliaceae bacterium N1Y90]